MKTALLAAATAALALAAGSVATAQSTDSITILHGIPGLTVDLVIDGELVIAVFEAGDTQDLTPLAGETLVNIEAKASGSDAVVIGPIDSYDVPDRGNASVVVHLAEDGEPTITTFFNTGGPAEQGRGLLTLRHIASAPDIALEVGADTLLAEVANREEATVVLPAGEVTDAWIVVDRERVAEVPTLMLDADTQLVVYVAGSAEEQNFEFYRQVISGGDITSIPTGSEQVDVEADQTGDGTPQPAEVNTGAPIVASSWWSWDRLVIGLLLALGSLAVLARLALERRRASVSD